MKQFEWLITVASIAALGWFAATTIFPPVAASERGRFGISDMTQVATVSIWLVHDAAHPAQCVLMVRSGAALTATPWMCQ